MSGDSNNRSALQRRNCPARLLVIGPFCSTFMRGRSLRRKRSFMEIATAIGATTDPDHVHANTAPEVNARIERAMRDRIIAYANRPPEDISGRIAELEQEWDIERWLECNASALAFSGVALSFIGGRKWLLLPALVLPMLFYHAVQGWCPPVPLLRRLGVRTQREIDAERYALRLLRGDFDQGDSMQRAMRTLEPELRPVDH
jgi:hypothetical protein